MRTPSEREACICAMFDSFCVTVIRNYSRNLKRAAENRKKYDATGDEAVEYLIELLAHEDVYEAEQLVFYADGCPCVVLPGGLYYSYNIAHGSTLLSRYPMNRLTDMITNFGAVVVGCIVLKVWGFRKPAGIAVMLFSAFEVVMHIGIGIQDMGIFGKYGMNTLYSPGLITSLFGFLPVCIGLAIHLFKKKENRPKLVQWIMAIAATAVLGFLLINLPEATLGKEDSPYEFTNRGYYEQFGEQYEHDNGFEYFEPETVKEEQ